MTNSPIGDNYTSRNDAEQREIPKKGKYRMEDIYENGISVTEAAERLGVSAQTIRVGLQQGVFPFGVAFKTSENSQKYTYVIYPTKFVEYAGKFTCDEFTKPQGIPPRLQHSKSGRNARISGDFY